MNLEQELRNDILILRPRGRLDSSSSPELERVVTEQLDSGIQRLVFDLSGLDYISSAGLRVVLLTSMDIRRYLRKMIEQDLYDLPVLSYQELTQEINIQPLARIDL